MKIIKNWIDTVALGPEKFKCETTKVLCQTLSDSIGNRIMKYYRNFIFAAMAVDPRYCGNPKYLTPLQWERGYNAVILFLMKSEENDSSDESIENEMEEDVPHEAHLMDPYDLDEARPSNTATPSSVSDMKKEIKAEFQYLKSKPQKKKVLEFYKENENRLPHLAKAARHFLLASSSSIESERFFSDATALYEKKQRNRLGGKTGGRLLYVRVMQKKAALQKGMKQEESDDDTSDDDEPFDFGNPEEDEEDVDEEKE